MRHQLLFATLIITSLLGEVAHASGPVERLVQVLVAPSDPNVMVVRWGVASEGFLYSRDGGATFSALCSSAITPLAGLAGDAGISSITKLSAASVNSNAAALIDSDGRLQVTQLSGLWSDDGTGCSWSRGLVGGWPTSLQLDPDTGELLAVVNVSTQQGSSFEARALLLRRDASGTWTSFDQGGALVPHVATQQAYGGDLKLVKTDSGQRLYATVAVSMGSSAQQQLYVVRSDDGGKTWSSGAALPAELSETFSLVAVDPNEPKRLLGATTDDLAADVLWISEDEGSTFQKHGQLRELTGVAFASDGSVYVSDQGDAMDVGGLWTAPALGQTLTKVPETASLDCVSWSQAKNAFYVCQGDRVRLFDPASTSFVGENVVRISEVGGQLSCPGRDVAAICQDQLNLGASWCCTGHYPCTPFCSAYDVTTSSSGQRVFCGTSGLAYDIMSGRTCDSESASGDGGAGAAADAGSHDAGSLDAGARDGGTTDAATVKDQPSRKSDSGCSIGERRPRSESVGGALASLGLVLLLLGRNLRSHPSRK